jgi:hypothetical protein
MYDLIKFVSFSNLYLSKFLNISFICDILRNNQTSYSTKFVKKNA